MPSRSKWDSGFYLCVCVCFPSPSTFHVCEEADTPTFLQDNQPSSIFNLTPYLQPLPQTHSSSPPFILRCCRGHSCHGKLAYFYADTQNRLSHDPMGKVDAWVWRHQQHLSVSLSLTLCVCVGCGGVSFFYFPPWNQSSQCCSIWVIFPKDVECCFAFPAQESGFLAAASLGLREVHFYSSNPEKMGSYHSLCEEEHSFSSVSALY